MNPRHQPTARDMELDISLPVTPERLVQAIFREDAERNGE